MNGCENRININSLPRWGKVKPDTRKCGANLHTLAGVI
jgi:hypothetical protein